MENAVTRPAFKVERNGFAARFRRGRRGKRMKVAILAGGLGSRLAEETDSLPKPMVEIGGRPILWHIMMHYSHYDFRDFVFALGYKGEIIKKYMIDYSRLNHDLTVSTGTGRVKINGG